MNPTSLSPSLKLRRTRKLRRTKKVLAFGTFDLLHKGHIFYLEEAKKLGDELYVMVACDQAVKWAKGFTPEERERERLRKVKKMGFVDFAWIGEPVFRIEDYLRPILKIKPNIICLGYDQALNEEEWLKGKIREMDPKPKIVRTKPFKKHLYKTSIIKKRVREIR